MVSIKVKYIYITTSPCVAIDMQKERDEVIATIYFSPVALSLLLALQQERRHIVLALTPKYGDAKTKVFCCIFPFLCKCFHSFMADLKR